MSERRLLPEPQSNPVSTAASTNGGKRRLGAGSSPDRRAPVAELSHGTSEIAGAIITVGIVDRDILVRGGIRALLEQAESIRIVAEACNAGGAVELVVRHRPKVLLMDGDIAGMDGAAAAKYVRRVAPTTAVVLLASSTTDIHVERALRAGVAGCLLKDGNPLDLIAAVTAAVADGAVLSPKVAKWVLERIAEIDVDRVERARELVGSLTAREREVLEHVARGMANNEIGRALYLSEGGVKAHISRLLSKLNCGSRVQAALIAHDARLAVSSSGAYVTRPPVNSKD